MIPYDSCRKDNHLGEIVRGMCMDCGFIVGHEDESVRAIMMGTPIRGFASPKAEWLLYAERKIDVFAEAMKAEMRANAWKGDWFTKSPADMINEAYYHMAKLQVAMRKPGLLGLTCTCILPVEPDYDHQSPHDGEHDPERCSESDPMLEFAADVGNLMMMAMERLELLGIFDQPPAHVEPKEETDESVKDFYQV